MFEHKTISLAEQVFERLETEILWGAYQRGQILSENKLVTDLGVSRTPIREALQRLEQERLVEITQHGILVLGVTPKDLRDIYAIRMRIEGLAARETAKYATDEQLMQLKETLELQEYYVGKQNPDNIKGMDSQFHGLIYRFCDNIVLHDMLIALHTKIQKFRQEAVSDVKRARASLQEHQAILAAIAARNEDEAERLMNEHIAKARDFALKHTVL